MYVIRVRKSEDCPWKYFCNLENGFIVLSTEINHALVFFEKSDAHIMVGLIESMVYNLEPQMTICPISTDDEDKVDDSVWFNCSYYCICDNSFVPAAQEDPV